MTLELIAPAKLNLSLEVLGKRPDGYHEIVSVMQTIDLADTVALEGGADVRLAVDGPESSGVPADPAQNLAYRAALALRDEAGRPELGAAIRLTKRIPSGAGLGGGSSDAAAVLRGLNQFWSLGLETARLELIAAKLGSDVPFFLHGGTGYVYGRGEEVYPLGDAVNEPQDITLFLPYETIPDKTRRMYGLLTPDDYEDSGETRLMGHFLGLPFSISGVRADYGWIDYKNPFSRLIEFAAPHVGSAMAYCRASGLNVMTTGSGPAFFCRLPLSSLPLDLPLRLESWVNVVAVKYLTRAEALFIRES